MQLFFNGLKGFGVMYRLGADRILIAAAILVSLAAAAAVAAHMSQLAIPASGGIF
ncbi:MAG: hypothetical protein ORN49_10925 [Rhodobacteraceae bacterium]|nr:hypothetical protein [Paracoccaceae bacterium]